MASRKRVQAATGETRKGDPHMSIIDVIAYVLDVLQGTGIGG